MAALEIALATHNGAAHLAELLGSLFDQTCQDFDLIVADDKSVDRTLAILGKFQVPYPGRIRMVGFSDHSGSAAANFARLTNHVSADYLCFADQDDVWLPDKVQYSLDHMRSLEARYGTSCPILIHTDLRLVDSKLKLLNRSFWRHVSINPRRRTLQQMLVEISVAGCTMMANRALYVLARPIPPQAVMHDHWFALVAAAFGHIEYLPYGPILYRRHEAAVSHHGNRGVRAFLLRVLQVTSGSTAQRDRREFDRLAGQAAILLVRYRTLLRADQRELLAMFAGLSAAGHASRCADLLLCGVTRTGILRNIALFYLLCRTR